MLRTPAAATARQSAERRSAVSAGERPSFRSAPAMVMRSSSGGGPEMGSPRIPRRKRASKIWRHKEARKRGNGMCASNERYVLDSAITR